tara:strand:+ start:1976 stop:2098 length:123 start_codon:yes stop_codon:yes gene_type:complete
MFITPDSEAHVILRAYCDANEYDFKEELGTVSDWKGESES